MVLLFEKVHLIIVQIKLKKRPKRKCAVAQVEALGTIGKHKKITSSNKNNLINKINYLLDYALQKDMSVRATVVALEDLERGIFRSLSFLVLAVFKDLFSLGFIDPRW